MLENHYPKATFFSPGWHREDLEMLYGHGSYDFSNSYAMHMWFSSAKRIFNLEMKIKPKYFIKKKEIFKRIRKNDMEEESSPNNNYEKLKNRKIEERKRIMKELKRHTEENGWSTYQLMIRSVIPEDLLFDFVMLKK